MEEELSLSGYILFGTVLLITIVAIVVIYTLYYQRKNLSLKNSLERIEKEKQLELFKATIETQENERKRIAKDIHDGVGPYLTVLRARLEKYNQVLNYNPEFKNEIENDTELIDICIDTIREVCKELYPAFLIQFGFYSALKHFTEKLSTEKLITNFNILHKGIPVVMNEQNAINLFRIYQEVMNNILKHSNASSLIAFCETSFKTVKIFIRHNGTQFTNDDANILILKHKGLGLMNIYSRLTVLRGSIDYFTKTDEVCIEINVFVK